jgi:CrcB protein
MDTARFAPSCLAAIAVGGALGSIARYAMTLIVHQRTSAAFPVGTLAVNLIGCLLIGMFIQMRMHGGKSTAVDLFLTTGFCGGFTTFSTFSYETVDLLQHGLRLRALTYVLISVVGGLAAFTAGQSVVSRLR